ncbi:MAG: carboxypeptidase-like regulatory domain-containing protein [Terriglobales bacterium]
MMTRIQLVRSQTLVIWAFVLALLATPGAFAKNKDTTPGRLLTGKVLDRQDNAVVDAVVYVTDTRTRAVKTYIVGPDGTYRFPALATNVDYEIYAQAKGKTSDTKRMSQFDDRKVVEILLRIDTR